MKLAMLGGSFNPPHKGHLAAIKTAMKSLSIKNGCFLPAKQNPFKAGKSLPSFCQRFKDCKEFLRHNHTSKYKIFVSNFEDNFEGKAKHFETNFVLNNFVKKNPRTQIYWVMGLDCLKNFEKWGGFINFVNQFNIIIISRENCKAKISALNCKAAKILRGNPYRGICHLKQNYQKGLLFINSPAVNISSTKLRGL